MLLNRRRCCRGRENPVSPPAVGSGERPAPALGVLGSPFSSTACPLCLLAPPPPSPPVPLCLLAPPPTHTLHCSYKSDLESDPFGEKGSVWSFNYFFYNKKLKRILYFSCRGLSKTAVELSVTTDYKYNTGGWVEGGRGWAAGGLRGAGWAALGGLVAGGARAHGGARVAARWRRGLPAASKCWGAAGVQQAVCISAGLGAAPACCPNWPSAGESNSARPACPQMTRATRWMPPRAWPTKWTSDFHVLAT